MHVEFVITKLLNIMVIIVIHTGSVMSNSL